ncbi:Hypothetical predicted protein [Mytilus galloprovincialis]|uniref:OTU domain-containing protein n=1 Tax=Mytilus galloprovincialis TaxID=29158 RepID=A0A8B6HCC3_MYTGA|nr:Hypothetical predicted protein [Mytilus galloprovincialis]
MPLKDIFQKKIENSSSFLSDVWKPRCNEGNSAHQHKITEDNVVKDHHNIRKDGKNHSRTTKNCLQVQEVFENNYDDKEERHTGISCFCGSENCPLKKRLNDRLNREDPPEKRMINDFEMMRSFKASDGKSSFPFVSLMWFPGDSDDKGQFPSSYDDDDSYEPRSRDFGSSPAMKLFNEVFPGLFEGKSKSSYEKKNENTKKQSTDFDFLPKPSRPPPKPPRKIEGGLKFKFLVSINEDEKAKNDASLNTCEKSVIDRVDHFNNSKSNDDNESVSDNIVSPDENKLRISIDFSPHSLSEISKQKPDFSQSFPTSENSKSSLDKDSNQGLSLSFTGDLRSTDTSSKISEDDFKTSGSSQRKLLSEKTCSQGLKIDPHVGSMDDTLPYKSQQSNTFISHEMDDFDTPLDDIFGPEYGPDLEEFPDLFNHDEPEESHASCVNESIALDTACTDPETLLEEHMHHCPTAAHHHNVCCKCNQFTKNQHMLYELAITEGLEMHDVVPDGNCMFRAIIDQLRMQGELTLTCHSIRQMAVNYLKNNPLQDDGTHLEDFFVADDESWEEYLKRISRDGEWGDQIILR